MQQARNSDLRERERLIPAATTCSVSLETPLRMSEVRRRGSQSTDYSVRSMAGLHRAASMEPASGAARRGMEPDVVVQQAASRSRQGADWLFCVCLELTSAACFFSFGMGKNAKGCQTLCSSGLTGEGNTSVLRRLLFLRMAFQGERGRCTSVGCV
jgi:hypothetical protein